MVQTSTVVKSIAANTSQCALSKVPHVVWRLQGTRHFRSLTSQDIPFHSQTSTLVVIEQAMLLAKFLFEYLVFSSQIFDYFMLMLVSPTNDYEVEQVPRLQKEVHRRPNSVIINILNNQHLDIS